MGLALIILAALGGTAIVYKKVTKKNTSNNSSVKTESGSIPREYSISPSRVEFDKGLSQDEATAVTYAIATEKDGTKLREFGQVMLPDFPIASSLLLSKSGFIIYRGKPVGSLSSSGPVTKAASVAKPSTRNAPDIQSGLTFRGIAHGEPRFGGFLSDAWESTGGAVIERGSDIAKGGVNIVTHPADTVGSAWYIVTHPADDIKAFGKASVDALHTIPGMDEAGDLLKAFANTGFGEWALRIMATYEYFVLAPFVGSALASVTFALPGIAKGDAFTSSWMKETADRVIKTVQVLLGYEIPADIAAKGGEALNKFLAENPQFKEFAANVTKEISTAALSLKDKVGSELGQMIQDKVEGAIERGAEKLAKEYGLPPDFKKMAKDAGGIQEINAATAYDLIAKTDYQGTLSWDVLTGTDILGHMKAQRMGSVQTARTSITPGQQAIDRLNKEYRAKRPVVVKHYLQLARQ